MLMPSIFGENLFDEFMNDFPFFDDSDMRKAEKKLYGRRGKNIMKTDIQEKDDEYLLEMDLPGFTKDEIQMSLDNGYLTISAAKGLDQDTRRRRQASTFGKSVTQEACQRSFYVGGGITEADIKAAFKHGILTVHIPKKENKVPEKNYISIEG